MPRRDLCERCFDLYVLPACRQALSLAWYRAGRRGSAAKILIWTRLAFRDEEKRFGRSGNKFLFLEKKQKATESIYHFFPLSFHFFTFPQRNLLKCHASQIKKNC
jgi:hypothetical protein